MLRQEGHLSPGVWDQPGQYSDLISKQNRKSSIASSEFHKIEPRKLPCALGAGRYKPERVRGGGYWFLVPEKAVWEKALWVS
jgi:hypothetical protein